MARFDKTQPIDIENVVVDNEFAEQDISQIKVFQPAELKKEVTGLESIVKNNHQEQTIVDMKAIDEKRIGIAADHRGFEMKQKLTKYLNKKGYTVVDYGGDGLKDDDYTEFGFKLGEGTFRHEVEKGIAICGSGIGISIACNKVRLVRCAKVNNIKEVMWARRDNDANAIAISARMPLYKAKDIIDVFLGTKFSYKERHQKRVSDLNNYGGNNVT